MSLSVKYFSSEDEQSSANGPCKIYDTKLVIFHHFTSV